MDLNKLVLTAAEYKVMLNIPGRGTYAILTADSLDTDVSTEDEQVYVIGEEKPVANKQNGKKYSGSLSIQVGELSAILLSSGLQEGTQINGAILAITAIRGGFSRIYVDVNFNTEKINIKAKDKATMVNMDFTCLDVKN